jgi:hypothetical protein
MQYAPLIARTKPSLISVRKPARRSPNLLPMSFVTSTAGVLRIIYDRFPDLELRSDEIPTICSTLLWEDVRLPPSITDADVDGVIFSVLKPQWRKTAMIVLQALKKCEELGWPIEDEALAARIEVLAEAGRIEHQGDLRYWRHSEVRLQP